MRCAANVQVVVNRPCISREPRNGRVALCSSAVGETLRHKPYQQHPVTRSTENPLYQDVPFVPRTSYLYLRVVSGPNYQGLDRP